MIFDFNLATQLRLSAVKRWGIVEMSRQQSVAEHSYNVTLIALNLVGASVGHKGFSKEDESLLLTLCLVHDMPEVFSGDIPSTVKGAFKEELDDWETTSFPAFSATNASVHKRNPNIKLVIKVADIMESIIFAERYCIDIRKGQIITGLHADIDRFLDTGAISGDKDFRSSLRVGLEKLWAEETFDIRA